MPILDQTLAYGSVLFKRYVRRTLDRHHICERQRRAHQINAAFGRFSAKTILATDCVHLRKRNQNGISSQPETKRATTFFVPAFSKSISNLSPSISTIAP